MSDVNPYQSPADEATSAAAPAGLPIVLTGCITVAEFRAGIWLMKRTNPHTYLKFLWIPAIMLFYLSVVSLFLDDPYESQKIVLFIGAATAPLVYGWSWLRGWLKETRNARDKQGVYADHRYEFSQTGLLIERANAYQEVNWDGLGRFMSSDSVAVLLLSNGRNGVVLAKRTLQPPGRWEDLMSLLAAKVPGK